ncbi:unnamed protein product [Phytophthora fragariaefolia]|uniref:Unnamed protein product n=1 Tax=Phytophthora fragariaefolia TaxID=1490495 RepID=A0A9W7CIZ4_9STRA|nr:unnamed protein product [Phytophthora fragariaefolia]
MTAILFREWLCNFDVDMHKQKRKVVLLIDNASSHIISELHLNSVTVVFLPPNTTSKLQRLDAGIIAALKRRYRHRQLEQALDKEEEGIVRDIYDVDQLQAMRWRLRVRDPMDIDEFLCNPAEDRTEMQALSTDELLCDASDVAFLDTVGDERDDNSSDGGDLESAEDARPEPTTKEKADFVRGVIFMLSEHPDLDDKLMQGLRKLQTRVRDDLRREQQDRTTQTSIRSFFQA